MKAEATIDPQERGSVADLRALWMAQLGAQVGRRRPIAATCGAPHL